MKNTFFILLICLVFSACSKNQEAKIAETEKRETLLKQQEVQPDYSAYNNIELNTAAMPETIKSVDNWEIAYKLLDLNTTKDEFETSKKFEEKISKIKESELIGKLRLDRYVALKISHKDVSVNYDADKELLGYSINNFTGTILTNNRDLNASSSWMKTKKRVSDIGFLFEYYLTEKRKVITASEEINIDLRKKNNPLIRYIGAIKLTADKAKELKQHAVVYAIGEIIFPFLEEEISLPHDYNQTIVTYKKNIKFNLKSLWMVNEETGEILTKEFKVIPL